MQYSTCSMRVQIDSVKRWHDRYTFGGTAEHKQLHQSSDTLIVLALRAEAELLIRLSAARNMLPRCLRHLPVLEDPPVEPDDMRRQVCLYVA